MTTEEILQTFSDINFVYNNCSKYDTLKRMLDELTDIILDQIKAEIRQMPTISFNANDIYKADVLAIIDRYKAESEGV